MRPATFALGLWFCASQSILVVDCCCGSFCLHKDACQGCEGQGGMKGMGHSSGHGSCSSALGLKHSGGCGKDPCSHIEPQGDFDSVRAGHDFVPMFVLGIVPVIPVLPPDGHQISTDRHSHSPPHSEDPPLYIRNEVLLI